MIKTLKSGLNALTMLILLLTAPLASNAALLVFEDRGFIAPVVIGATGLNVNGTIYDISLFDARSKTCADIFFGCDDTDDFPFGIDFPDFMDPNLELGEIIAATEAFREQVLPQIPSAQFVEGCLGTGTGNCIFRIPYTIGMDLTTVITSELEYTTVGQERVFGANIGSDAPALALLQGGFFAAFVKFDLATTTPAPVPAPATVWLMVSALLGFAGVASRRRR